MRAAKDGAREAVFFDFDDAAPGPLAYDLAVFPWSRLLRGSSSTPDEGASIAWGRFLAGYAGVRDAPDADVGAVPTFVRLRHFLWLGELASRSHHWGSETMPTAWLRRQADLPDAWSTLELPVGGLRGR